MCDICDKESKQNGNALVLMPSFVRSLTFAICDSIVFKRVIIKRYELYQEYNKVYPDKLNAANVLTAVKNHFPEEYDKYGIEKLVVLL